MKPTAVSADALFEDHRGKLKWQWIAGLGASERRFDEVAVRAARSGADLVGYLNYIHPYRVQILGEREVAYLSRGSEEDCVRRISRIVTLEPPVLVLADGQVAPDALLRVCERAQIPMFATPESSAFVIDVLRAYLSKHFADRTTMHGVFMDILGLGVLITGESGLGKSELGLELISRGNGLVADDAVDLFRINQTTIEARCPELLLNLLEVRGIGLLDIRAIFGETAVRRKMRLKLIVHLVRRENFERDYERIPTEPLTQDVLGIPVRKVVIQVVAGRNIAVLVEAAVRNTILQMRGIDTYQDFMLRQQAAMNGGNGSSNA
jgi:HPr kinase/phosphorylase